MDIKTVWHFIRGTSVTRDATLTACAFACYGLLPVWKENSSFHQIADHSSVVYAGIEFLLGLLLVLRSNAAYERWWEARTLWGKLVNISRNLMIKAKVYAQPEVAELEQLHGYVVAFASQLKSKLRGYQIAGQDQHTHLPRDRSTEIYSMLVRWRDEGRISDDVLRILDSEAREFMEVCGACERIATTPFPPSYKILLTQGVLLFMLILPWSLTTDLGVWQIPVTFLHSYFYFGLLYLAHTQESPFGEHEDDLDLEGICDVIHTTSY